MEVVASPSQGRTAAAQCSLFTKKSVPVIFEPPCNIALCNKCDINVRAGGLFEEESIQKILSHLIILVNNAVLQMQWIFIQCLLCNKTNCSFY